MTGVYLVPPEDPRALAEAVLAFAKERTHVLRQELHREVRHLLGAETIGKKVIEEVCEVTLGGVSRN